MIDRIERTRAIVDAGGLPTDQFQIQWQRLCEAVEAAVEQDQTAAWADPTGTTSRATFDTATATTSDVAQRLAALIADLRTIGVLS